MKLSTCTGKLATMALLAVTVALAAGCEGQSKIREGYGKPWYGGYFPHRTEPVQIPEPAPAPAPAPTGTCANYRPAAPAGTSVSALAFPTGSTSTSAILLHQVMPQQVRAGANYDMEIHVTNITSGTLQNVVVNGESIDNMTIVSSNPAAGRGAAGNTQWVLGDLASCKTAVIRVVAKADKVGTASNCLSVSYNNVLCSALQVVQPALQITKTMTSEAILCDVITATVEVKNTGTGPAENVVIKDNLPAGLTTTDGKQSVELAVGNLAGGQSATRTMQLKASRKGRFENNASASATGGLSANSNTVAVVVKQPALALNIKCPERVFLGRDMCYEVTVKNTGDAPAANTTVSCPMPAGSSFIRASDGGAQTGGSVTWNVGTLAPEASKTLSFCVRSNTAGTFQTTATARATCADEVTANCSTNLVGVPALLLDGTDDPDPIEVGQTTTYTLTVTNQGTAPLTTIRLVCTMDEGDTMEHVSNTGPTAGTLQGRTITFAPIARLEPKESRTYRIVIRAVKEGQVSFKGEASSAEITRPLVKIETTNFYR